MIRTVTLAWACVALLALTVQPAQAMPTFDVFGPLPEATFGGSGIPNNAVAISTFGDGGGNTITLGLTATQRFTEPPVGNDGAGTFSALPGGFPGSTAHVPADPTLARWNFNYFVKIEGGATLSDFIIQWLYDFDPGADTAESDLGVWDLSLTFPTDTLSQGSQNLGFGFLAAGFPGVIAPPAFGAFDPNTAGEYTFALRVFQLGSDPAMDEPLGAASINVNTVPEPISASLFGIGALGLAIGGARRRRRKQTA